MPLVDVPIEQAFPFPGFLPERFARNGLAPSGRDARLIARALNHLIARAGTIIPGMEVLPASARNTASELALWRTRYRATANGTTLVNRVQCIPTDDTSGTPTVYVKVDGVAQTSMTHNTRCRSGEGTDLTDIFTLEQEITVTAGAQHTVELWTKDKCRVVGWFMHEKPRDSLAIGTDTVIDYTRILPLSGIYDADVQDLVVDIALEIFQKMRGSHMSWSVPDPASAIVPGSATPTNIWDGSTARTSSTVGADCPTQYRENYMEQFAATPAIATYAWCYAQSDSGSGIKVRFVGTNGSADITVNGAAGIYSTTSFTLAPSASGDKVDVQAYQNSGTGKVFSVGMFPLIGS